MPLGGAALTAAREIQVPILALLLMGACVAKAQRAVRTRSFDAAIRPAALFPLRLRNPTTIALCASELCLGVGLMVTAGEPGASDPAMTVRAATALLFAIAVAALNEMRIRRPAAGCGCFGDLSETPVTMRSLARSALLCAGALASIGAPPLRLPSSLGQALLLLTAATGELLLLAAVSPETREVMIRLGYCEPCEARRLPVSRTMASLHGSRAWRHYRPCLTGVVPSDIWREGCWRFIIYPTVIDDRMVDIVFSVYLQARRPPVRAAIVDATEADVPEPHVPGSYVMVPPPRPAPERAPTFTPIATVRARSAATKRGVPGGRPPGLAPRASGPLPMLGQTAPLHRLGRWPLPVPSPAQPATASTAAGNTATGNTASSKAATGNAATSHAASGNAATSHAATSQAAPRQPNLPAPSPVQAATGLASTDHAGPRQPRFLPHHDPIPNGTRARGR